MSDFFTRGIAEADPLIADALTAELERQRSHIELIASENIVSRAVLDVLGHAITNKTLEGYPGRRFHGGGEYVDVVEQTAIDRARELFDCDYVNVQPHSGTQANQAVFFATVKPGDCILSLDLAAGGHLSHGAPPNQSGRWFDAHHYGVERDSGLIDYDQAEALALELRPRLLITGGSAYPRCIDFERMRDIADRAGSLLLVDMAHFAGLVAAGVHPSPLPLADIVTCTTTKTMRGPRGGMILARDANWSKAMQPAIFPGVQGSLHSQIIAAKAVCLGEALSDDFRVYGQRVVDNAQVLAQTLLQNDVSLISGGTDTHIVLLDFSALGLCGQQVQDSLAEVNLTSNKNPIPFDSPRPAEWAGLRLGVAAATTRGLGRAEFQQLGQIVARAVERCRGNDKAGVDRDRQQVLSFCERFPVYSR